MGNFRVFKKSVKFTFRTKRRFLVFLLIFGIVSTFIAFYIDTLDDLRTDRLLEQKGVVMVQDSYTDVSYVEGNLMLNDILALAESDSDIKIQDSVIFHYIELDSYIRLYSMDIDHPWYSDFVKPSLVVDGRYPEKASEILIPAGAKQIYNSTSTGVVVESKVAVGQKFSFENNQSDSIDLKVVGTFDTSNIQEREDSDRLWIFIDESMFEPMLELFGKTTADAFTYSITFVVPGTILSTDTHELVTALNRMIINDFLQSDTNIGQYGDWEPQPQILPSQNALDEATNNLVNLMFVVLGGAILTTMFAYLISRFRRREVAILKAMGYSQSSVRTTLVAEIVTIAFFGFAFGLSLAQGLLYYLSDFNRTSLLSRDAVLAAFVINVILTLPGMLLVSWRVLRVSPSEAFRDR
ncbi:MAG: ABC transporter permease [Candidatus Heimdallarchaeota archaeon]|nr:ABC transporter permease [Candidatus Heimdallarchaeota archaeon]